MKEEIYNGFKISFDEKKEVWYANISEDGSDANLSSPETRNEDSSLKKLKEKLDLIKRRKFARRNVLIRAPGRYRRGGGMDDKYTPEYIEGTMTSVGPNGYVYVVPKGSKHPEKFRIGNASWDNGEIDVYDDTPDNRALIAEIEEAGRAEWKAEIAQNKGRERLKKMQGKKLYKEVYGKDL